MLNHQRRERAAKIAHFTDSAEPSYAEIVRRRSASACSTTGPKNTTAQLDEHFASWRARCADRQGHFVADGNIGSDKEWADAPVRVLVLAKEANDRTGFNHDLRKLFRNPNDAGPQRTKFQFNVGRWAYALHEQRKRGVLPPFDEADQASNRRGALWQSAILNLKKNAGGASAKFSEVRQAAHRDKSLILKEIEILNPQVVIFGRDLESTALVEAIVDDLTKCNEMWYSRANQLWVRHWHPARVGMSDLKLYAEFINTLRRLPIAEIP